MKKGKTLLGMLTILLMAISLSANGAKNDPIIDTFPWTENFDASSSIPDGWTVHNLDGDDVEWEIHTMFTHSAPNAIRHNYSGAIPDPGQNGWLITPAINVPETGNFAFSWWSFNDWPPAYIYNGLWINTVADPDDRDWVELWTPNSVEFEWSQQTISLMPYAGQTVYLAFVYTGYEGDTWYVDDVKVSELTQDLLPPVISHLPVLNNPRDDAYYRVTATIVDDPIWNSPIGGASLIYHAQAGTNWSNPIPMTLVEGETDLYEGFIPPLPHGSFVLYKITGWDIHNNSTTYQTMYFEVDNPIWMHQDAGGTGFMAIDDGSFGPAIIFHNPYYGSEVPLKILEIEGTAYLPCNTEIKVYEVEDDDSYHLVSTIPITMTGYTVNPAYDFFDVSAYNVEVSSPRFMIAFRDMGAGNYFIYDEEYLYTPLYVFIGEELRTATATGSWCIGAYVTNGSSAGLASPASLSADVVRNNVSLYWSAPESIQAQRLASSAAFENTAVQRRSITHTPKATTQSFASPEISGYALGESKQKRNPTLLGYKAYRNGSLISSITGTTTFTYTDHGVPNGNHVYGVSALYDEGESYPVEVDVNVNLQSVPAIFEDSFESYADFATQFAPWTLIDRDNSQTYGFSNTSFPGMTGTMAYIIFNPDATVPPLEGATVYDGSKMAASFAAMNPPNDDYLITPLIELNTNSYVSFYAKSHTAQYGMERMKILVSTGSDPTDIDSFESISGHNDTLIYPIWHNYIYDLSPYDNSSVYIAFNCRSDDAFVLFVDKVSVHSDPVSVDDENSPALSTNLKGNYPNPFNPNTTIAYSVKEAGDVKIDIYNLKGQHIKSLVERSMTPGEYSTMWDGLDSAGNPVASGVYLYKMKTKDYQAIKRMMLMK